jgi:hypothetical protein
MEFEKEVATLYSLPKSASKCSRERQISICEKAATFLDGNSEPPRLGNLSSDDVVSHAVRSCGEAVADAKKRFAI